VGTLTVGFFESGPLAGVFTVAVDGEVEAAGVLEVAVARAESAVFSLPTPIVLLEPLEPQPAIRIATPKAARTVVGRVGMLLK
jgi:hypothetical protein